MRGGGGVNLVDLDTGFRHFVPVHGILVGRGGGSHIRFPCRSVHLLGNIFFLPEERTIFFTTCASYIFNVISFFHFSIFSFRFFSNCPIGSRPRFPTNICVQLCLQISILVLLCVSFSSYLFRNDPPVYQLTALLTEILNYSRHYSRTCTL
jgi:hypothetical protein